MWCCSVDPRGYFTCLSKLSMHCLMTHCVLFLLEISLNTDTQKRELYHTPIVLVWCFSIVHAPGFMKQFIVILDLSFHSYINLNLLRDTLQCHANWLLLFCSSSNWLIPRSLVCPIIISFKGHLTTRLPRLLNQLLQKTMFGLYNFYLI